MRYLQLALLFALLIAPSIATAVEPAEAEAATDERTADEHTSDERTADEDDDRTLQLHYRVWGDRADTPSFEDDVDGRSALRQYLRARLDIGDDDLGMIAEVDLLAGQLAGDQPAAIPHEADTGTGAGRDPFEPSRIVEPRQFYGKWTSPVGQLSAGLQTSQWGLGILANSGAADREGLFNQNFGGDRVVRAVFATAPLRPLIDSPVARDIYLAVGGDTVWRDENADFLAGDRAYQGIVAALYDTEATKGGTYLVYRNQSDRDGDFLEVFAVDLYADHSFVVADDWRVRAAAEGALLTGSTDRTLTEGSAEPVSVLGLGAASEFEVRYEPAQVGLQLLAGMASGDANASDDTLYRFRFDPNYDVGLVLFDHYLPAVTRASVDRVDDPARSGQPPKGLGGLVNDGGVENAWYLSPGVLYGDPDGFLAGVNFLWAKADQPIADPYLSFEGGGQLAGPNGRTPASDDLGMELDAALRYRYMPTDRLTLELKGEYGIFFPGEAFDDASGGSDEAQSLARVRASVLW